ncbi:uncharacterized protein [Notamacropus eugenii]
MGRRHRIFPKELVQFPQNSLYHQASSVLLPCPPHRISPFWEKEYRSKAELTSLLKQPSGTPQPPHRHYHKNIQEPPPRIKHPAVASKMPQLDNRAMAVPLPHLHHLAKPSSHHKHRTVAPVLPLPRTDIPTKKTPGLLATIEQCLIPPLGPKHQHDSSSDPDHRLENPSGSDHLPKIFPACDHSGIENPTLINQNNPNPPFSDHQTEVPLGESHRPRATTVARIVSDTQAKTNGPLTKTTTQGTRALPRPRRRIKATNALLGLFNLDPVLHPLAKSIPYSLWTRVPHFRTSVLNYWVQAQPLKASRDLWPREAVSFLQYHDRRPRPLAVPTSHLNRRNRSTTVYRYNPRLPRAPCPIAHTSVQTEQNNWETMLLRRYLLETCSSSTDAQPSITPSETSISVKTEKESWEAVSQGTDVRNTPPSSPLLETDMTPEPGVHVSIQTELDTWDTVFRRRDLQDTPPSSPVLEFDMTPEPGVHVSIQTELDTWDTLFRRRDLQDTPPSSPVLEIDMTPEPGVHVSIQTEPDTWDTIFLRRDLQDTPPSSPVLEADMTPEPGVHVFVQTESDTWDTISPRTDLQDTPLSSPDTETDTVPEPTIHVSIQTEPDPWETIFSETDQDTDRDDMITLLDSSPQKITLSCPPQWTTPPSRPDQAEDMPDFNALITLHPELEQKTMPQETDHLAILPSSPDLDTKNISEPIIYESVPIKQEYQEKILPILLGISNHQEITLTDEDHETAPPLDLDIQERTFSSPDEATTPLPSPYHQAEDISNPDVQAVLQQTLQQWATLSEETNLWDTLMLSTDSETETAPVVLDPISDVIEQEKFEIIDIMPLRIEDQEPNQIVEDYEATPLSLNSDDQEKALPWPDHQAPPSLSPDQKQESEDTAHDLAQDVVQRHHESGEKTPPRTDLKIKILTDQEDEATHPVDLGPEDPAQFVLEPQIISLPGPDQQAEDIPDLSAQVSLQPEPDSSDTMSPGTELQYNTLDDQDQRVMPPLSLDHEEMTLSSPDPCAKHQSSPDRQSEAAEDLSTQAVSPTDREHSVKSSEGQEQATHPPSSNFSVTLPSTSENEDEAGTEPTDMPSIPPENVTEEETVTPSPDKTVSLSGSSHQTKAPTGCDQKPETEMSSDHQDKVEPGPPHQFLMTPKRQSELRLNYIKPYTIEGGTVSDKTVQAIINSIPQEKIKDDICKQILLPPSLDGYSPCNYMVCLICASWIPDGCPHEGMKYPCEAQLLAIPIPVPTSEEEIDVKFVLKCPQATVASLFSTSNIHSHLKKSTESAELSQSDSMIPALSRPKWLHFILGKSLPQGKRDITKSLELSIDQVIEEGTSSKEGEKAKLHRTSFRSLLERFQWKQKETK